MAIKNPTTSNCGREDDDALIEFSNFRSILSAFNFLSSPTVGSLADWTRRKCHILHLQSEGCCEMTPTCFHMTFSDVIFASIETTLTYQLRYGVQEEPIQVSFTTFCFKLCGSVIVYLPFVYASSFPTDEVLMTEPSLTRGVRSWYVSCSEFGCTSSNVPRPKMCLKVRG
jgi:hypothetical protein